MKKFLKCNVFFLFLLVAAQIVVAQNKINTTFAGLETPTMAQVSVICINSIGEPEAVREVYDAGEFDYVEPLNNYTVFFLFILLVPILLLQRAYFYLTKRRNWIADEVENGLPELKMRVLRAFFVYLFIPFCLGYVVVSQRATWHLGGWDIALVMYAYLVFAVWDARRRRRKVFDTCYGNLPEAEWYSRRKAVRFNGWDNVLLFPIPFIWLKIKDDHMLRRVRNHPRESGDVSLNKLDKISKALFLNKNQMLEEEQGTVSYDVWRNAEMNITEVIGYKNLSKSRYER